MNEQTEIQPYQHHPVVTVVKDQATTTSVDVARYFDKQHKNVLRDVETILRDLVKVGLPEEFSRLNFEPAEYLDRQKKPRPMYRLTKDAFYITAMGFTGPEAMKFKLAYIAEFNRMEERLKHLTDGKLIELQEESHEHLKEIRDLLIFKIAHSTRHYVRPSSEEERQAIIELKLQGEKTSHIAKQTGWSIETVCRILARARKAGKIPPLPLSEKLKIIHLHPEWLKEVQEWNASCSMKIS